MELDISKLAEDLTPSVISIINEMPEDDFAAAKIAQVKKDIHPLIIGKDIAEVLQVATKELYGGIKDTDYDLLITEKIENTIIEKIEAKLNGCDFDNLYPWTKCEDQVAKDMAERIFNALFFCDELILDLQKYNSDLDSVEKYFQGKISNHESISDDIIHYKKQFKNKLLIIEKKAKENYNEYLEGQGEYLLSSGYSNIEDTFYDMPDYDKIDIIIQIPYNTYKNVIDDFEKLEKKKYEGGYFRFNEIYKIQDALNELGRIEGHLKKDWIPYLAKTIFDSGELGAMKRNISIFNSIEQIKKMQKDRGVDNNALKIPIPVIALMYIYRKKAGELVDITLENRDEIAEYYGWTAKTSGRQLFDDFKNYDLDKSKRIKSKIAFAEPGYERSKDSIIKNLTRAVKELASFPKALKVAKEELAEADR